jgi:hypothetical protein
MKSRRHVTEAGSSDERRAPRGAAASASASVLVASLEGMHARPGISGRGVG